MPAPVKRPGLYEYTNFHATQQEMFTFKMLTVHAKPARGKYFGLHERVFLESLTD
jgi:hypothetical protein